MQELIFLTSRHRSHSPLSVLYKANTVETWDCLSLCLGELDIGKRQFVCSRCEWIWVFLKPQLSLDILIFGYFYGESV